MKRTYSLVINCEIMILLFERYVNSPKTVAGSAVLLWVRLPRKWIVKRNGESTSATTVSILEGRDLTNLQSLYLEIHTCISDVNMFFIYIFIFFSEYFILIFRFLRGLPKASFKTLCFLRHYLYWRSINFSVDPMAFLGNGSGTWRE